MTPEVKRLNKIDSQLAEAKRILGDATAVYNEASAAFSAVAKPLWEERENLLCNLPDDADYGNGQGGPGE